jgi:hypothetical protein
MSVTATTLGAAGGRRFESKISAFGSDFGFARQ